MIIDHIFVLHGRNEHIAYLRQERIHIDISDVSSLTGLNLYSIRSAKLNQKN